MYNSTSIFNGKAMLINENNNQLGNNNYDQNSNYDNNNDYQNNMNNQQIPNNNFSSNEMDNNTFYEGELKGLSPINFDDKIMGGQKSKDFLRGKTPNINGVNDYSQRVDFLTGKHKTFNLFNSNVSNINDNFNKLNNHDKLNNMNNSFQGLSMLNNPNKTNKNNFMDMLKMKNKKMNNKISDMMIEQKNKKNNKSYYNNALMNINNFKTSKNIVNDMLGFNNTSNMKRNKDSNSFNVFNMLNNNKRKDFIVKDFINISDNKEFIKRNLDTSKKIFSNINFNTDSIMNKRINQQQGLAMFGDLDKDKVINIFDCDPLDPNKQGERHSPETLMGATMVEPYGVKENSPTIQTYELENDLPINNNENDMTDDVNKVNDVYPDTMSVNINFETMGNFITERQIDVDGDGEVDDVDKQIYNDMSLNDQLAFAQKGYMNSTGKDRKNYGDLLVRLSKQTTSPAEIEKSKRASEKLEFEREKFQTAQSEKQAEKARKSDIEKQKLEFQREQFRVGMKLPEQKFEFQKEQFLAGQQLAEKKLTLQEAREQAKEKREELKSKRQYELEKAKLRSAQTKGDLALWESKIKAGSNILGSLVGGSDKPSDFKDIVGLGGPRGIGDTQYMTGISPGVGQGFGMVSGMGVGMMPFESKVATSVGVPSYKSFSQTVFESVGGKELETSSPYSEQVLTPQQMTQPSQTSQIQASQIQAPQMQAPQMQAPQVQAPQVQTPQIQASQMQTSQMQTSQMQAPQVQGQTQPGMVPMTSQDDLEYQKYLKESAGKVGYRRGSYKKRY